MKRIQTLILLVSISCLSGFFSSVYAKTNTLSLVKTTPSPLASPSSTAQDIQPMQPQEEYILPYPGILPDHPLYFLKSIRDSILESLIVDPARKAEFYLLTADKHLSMSMQLSDQSKVALMSHVATKGEAYMTKAVSALKTVQQSGKVVSSSTVDKVEKSLAKHADVLQNLVSKATDNGGKSSVDLAIETVKKLQQEVASLR